MCKGRLFSVCFLSNGAHTGQHLAPNMGTILKYQNHRYKAQTCATKESPKKDACLQSKHCSKKAQDLLIQSQMQFFFFFCHLQSANDCESALHIDLGLQINFSESMN